MKKLLMTLIICILVASGYAQEENRFVVRILKKELDNQTNLTEYYSKNGMYLIKNGIYHFRINRKNYNYYRIIDIKNDSIQIVWAMDSIPVIRIHLNELNRVIFPSLHDGRSGWPNPTMNKRSHSFDILAHDKYKLEHFRICLDEDCNDFYKAFGFMTSGYGWKPIYKENGETFMLDKSVVHKLSK